MYRYVFKRVKETFDFGINARKSYACQKASSLKYKNQDERYHDQQQQQLSRQVLRFQEINFLTPIEQNKKRYEDFKRKYSCKHPYNYNPFLHAITWSTALVAGFYAAQILSLYRRNQRLDPKKCFYTRYLDCKNRFLQKKLVCSHYAKQRHQNQKCIAPPKPQFQCPLKKLLSRKKSSQASSSSSSERKQQATEQNDDNISGWRHVGFIQNGLFEKRFDTFYNNFGDTSTYKRVFFNVNNDSNQTLVKSKDNSNDAKSIDSLKSEDETIDKVLENLTDMIGEMEFQLGVECILHGHFEEGVEHFRMAASSNHAGSLFNLALLYEQGLGVKRDRGIAYKLYKSAGELGHDKALFNQGVFHAKGFGGVKKSFRMAKRFFQKSAALGNSDAVEALSMLLPDYQKSLSPVPDDFISDDISKSSSLILESAEYRGNIRSIIIT